MDLTAKAICIKPTPYRVYTVGYYERRSIDFLDNEIAQWEPQRSSHPYRLTALRCEGKLPIDRADDSTTPQISRARFLADAADPTVDVVFDKIVDASTAEEVANYTFSTGEYPLSATLQPDGRTV